MYVWNYRLGRLERRPFKSTCYFKKMANSIQHRGPDAEGFWFSPHAAFAHRRLIVIDPEGGTQPKTFRAGDYTYALTYNGEIYNFRELREQLQNVGMHLKPIQIQKYYYMLI